MERAGENEGERLSLHWAPASSQQDSPLLLGSDHARRMAPNIGFFSRSCHSSKISPPILFLEVDTLGRVRGLCCVVRNWRHFSEFWFSKCNSWKLMSKKKIQAMIKVWYELICHYNTTPLARHFRPGFGKGSRYLGWQFHLKDRKLSAFFSLVSWFNEHTNRPSPYAPNTSLLFFKKQFGKMPRQEAWKKLEKASRHIFVAWDSKCTSD